ncbi:MAG: bifunctional demethylmenaquinone methyltransferase/2-methoxy-6-polyprenyl-1,4-benzoquinol methylase UbiE [Phycisphaerales bacterium]|nr:bifunctional demethylmenaquinone methyltransferase/2-methoxy-6-polyprenyl-1,4-benzoquinol methylase UbiE [Phycisphaerales bacterium]
MSADDLNNTPSPAWTSSDLKENPHAAGDKAGRVQKMFDAIAGRYDLNNRLHSLGRDQAWRRRTAQAAVTGPNDRILDVACGTGDLSEALANQCPASVHGIDFSRGMLDVAIAKTHSRTRRSGVPVPTYAQGNAMELDLPDASFEACTIAFGIRNVVDPAAALAEFHRVLTPGGRCLILEFSEPRNPLLRSISNIYNRRIMPFTATIISGDRSGAYRYLPRSMETFLSPAELADQIRAAGFTMDVQRPMTFGICTLSIAQKS